MKCQILFSGKNKKNNIILSSAENAQRVVKVKVLSAAFVTWTCMYSLISTRLSVLLLWNMILSLIIITLSN